jgi:hypothetical protein
MTQEAIVQIEGDGNSVREGSMKIWTVLPLFVLGLTSLLFFVYVTAPPSPLPSPKVAYSLPIAVALELTDQYRIQAQNPVSSTMQRCVQLQAITHAWLMAHETTLYTQWGELANTVCNRAMNGL